jgi:hypothetical protein
MFRFCSLLLITWLLAVLPRLAAATNPTLVIKGLGSGTSDITAFVDQVQIIDASGNVVAGAVGDPSFETVATSTYVYQPAGSAWAFVGDGSGTGPGAGLTANGSGFGPPTAPAGMQAAFVQRTGYLHQVLTLGAGTYRVRFQIAQRGGNSVAQQLDVQLLGVSVGTASLGSSSAYATYTSGPFTVTSGAPTISSFSPSAAAAGATVTLTGTNLSGTSSLTVNGVAAPNVVVLSNTQLTFTVPTGTSATQQVTLTTPDGTASSTAFTVAPGLVSTIPAANARRAPRLGSPVNLTFSDALAASTLPNLAVFSAQVGGRKAGQWTGGGTPTVSFRSTLPGRRANFQPGEVVSVSVPRTVQASGGRAVGRQVFQFTAAVGGTGTGAFSGGSDPGVGNNPYSVALGDVDGDGDLDLLTANAGSNTVSVRLNDGAGNFSGGSDPGVGSAPYSVAVGDVDGDGDLDLLTANAGSNTVSVRLNDGAGHFSGGSNPSVGSGPYGVALGDVDGDGDLDLLAANYDSNTVSVRLNDGAGTFSGGSNPSVGSGPYGVALGDVDGDGDLDLLAANDNSSTISVRLNDGAGTFSGGSDPSVGGNPRNVVVGDVDGDGDLDLLTANYYGNSVSVRLNDGAGTFSGGSNPGVGNGSYSVAVGDVDGDGDLDLLTANSNSSTVSVRLNGGTTLAVTALSPLPVAVAAPAASPVQASFNQALAASSAPGLRVFSAQRGGLRTRGATPATVGGNTLTYTPPGARPWLPGETVYSTLTTAVAASGGATLPRARVQQFTVATGGTGRGNFLAPATNAEPGVGRQPYSVAVGDVDGDGDLDLLTANYNSNTVSVRLNDGAGTFSGGSNPGVGNSPTSVALGDVDGDGDLDLLTANYFGNSVSVRLNDGAGTFSGGSDPSVGSQPSSVALGDVDGDGDLDLLAANYGINTVSMRLNDGAGHFSGGSELGVGNRPASVAVGDVDGDGDLDLLTANLGSNTVSVRLNDGAGTFSGGSNPGVGGNPQSVAVGDVDGDGDLDLLTANFISGTVSVRLNDGAGTFSGGSDPGVGSFPRSVAVGDVDGDGDLDLLAANYDSNTVSVRLNNGAGTFSGGSDPGVGSSPFSVAVSDVDGDGDLDLLTANLGSNTVSVRLNSPPVPVISGASPAAAGVGIPVTLTGTSLQVGTAVPTVTVGGVAATVTAGSATSLTFVVPAGVVPGTFAVVVTTPTGSASRSYTVLAAPGNALAFDGSGDYVSLPPGVAAALQNDFTLEYWVRTTQAGTGSSGGQWWQGTGLVDGEVTGPTADYGTSLLAGRVAFGVGNPSGTDVTIQSTTLINDGRWHYVVATRQASTGALALYVDGQPQATGTGSTAARTAPPQLTLGTVQSTTSGSNFFQGSLDEVRFWSQVRSAQDVAAAYQAGPQTNLSQSGLAAYYSFDEGLPSGANADATTLYDLTPNALAGTLSGFALASGSTSNFVASYALVVPTATAATNRTSTGFTANWTAPVMGNLDSYLLDVSTAADFTAPVAGSPFAVAASARSKALTGLANGASYYYRLRAELSSLTGQGAPSNTVVVSQPLPVSLVAFTAERLGADGLLRWTTASELNNAYFQVESSIDGTTFQPLGRVDGAGTSSQAHSYQFIDAALARYAMPLVYYRLRQVDAGGTSAYSTVRTVQVPPVAGLVVQVYPNPSQPATEVVVVIRTDQAGPATLRLTNAVGQQLSQQQVVLPLGSSSVMLKDTPGLPTGVYILRVQQGGQQQTLKLVSQ